MFIHCRLSLGFSRTAVGGIAFCWRLVQCTTFLSAPWSVYGLDIEDDHLMTLAFNLRFVCAADHRKDGGICQRMTVWNGRQSGKLHIINVAFYYTRVSLVPHVLPRALVNSVPVSQRIRFDSVLYFIVLPTSMLLTVYGRMSDGCEYDWTGDLFSSNTVSMSPHISSSSAAKICGIFLQCNVPLAHK